MQSSERYIPHDPSVPRHRELEAIKNDFVKALTTNLDLVYRHTPDRDARPGGAIYVGTAGSAVMCYYLARLDLSGSERRPSLSSPDILPSGDDFLLQAYADDFNSLAPRKSSFLETYVGVATLVILRVLQTPSARRASSKVASAADWRPAIRLLREMTNLVVQDDRQKMGPGSSVLDDGDSEVLYGRAGFLYALLLLRSARREAEADMSEVAIAVDGLVSDASIKAVFDSIIGRGIAGAEIYNRDANDGGVRPALMWTWHGKRYLGGAHGVAGILHMLLLCPPSVVASHYAAILQTVEWLIGLQDTNGNWPSSAPKRSSRRDRVESDVVHWCHGAPGTMILLSTLLRRAPFINGPAKLPPLLHDKVIASLSRAADLVFVRGLLRKGVGLCHGVAGSVFALLAAHDGLPATTNDHDVHFRRAIKLAHLATNYPTLTRRGEMRTPDRSWSLYEGTAGMCCAWGEILLRMGSGGECAVRSRSACGCGMPGFDDLRVEG